MDLFLQNMSGYFFIWNFWLTLNEIVQKLWSYSQHLWEKVNCPMTFFEILTWTFLGCLRSINNGGRILRFWPQIFSLGKTNLQNLRQLCMTSSPKVLIYLSLLFFHQHTLVLQSVGNKYYLIWVGFIYIFWCSLSSTSSILENRFQSIYYLQMTSSEGFQH